jgi:hypothetical protein
VRDDHIPRTGPRNVLAEVGGTIDESGATLCVYGADLQPDEVTALLGVQPTTSFLRGYEKGPRSPPMRHGGWFLTVRGRAPNGPETQVAELLARLPEAGTVWEELNRRYKTSLSIGLHMSGWNKGFDLPRNLATVASSLPPDRGAIQGPHCRPPRRY